MVRGTVQRLRGRWFVGCCSLLLAGRGFTLPSYAMRRLQVVLGHLNRQPASGPEPAPRAAPCWSGAPRKSAEDVVVVHGRRTAIGRSGRGGFKVRPLGSGAGCEMAARGGLASGSSVR